MKVKIKKINAFTDSISAGNPAGVVLNSPILTNSQMKLISKIIKVSETAFIFPGNIVDYDVRFFSPKIEVDLCGHATIATYYGMLMENYFPKKKFLLIKQNTNSGIIPIEIYHKKNGDFDKIMMIQNNPEFKDINIDFSEIADALNISKESINQKFPKQTVSTGLYTLPICIDSFNKIKKIRPNFNKIKKICKKYNVGSIHIFTFDTIESDSIYHSRNFAPLYGINEDPVTGTANGAVCSYLFFNKIIEKNELICEQGDIIKRSGRVFVNIKDNKIKVGGRAKFVEEIEIGF
jgi:PhzF family phenazine biosynthesis protein